MASCAVRGLEFGVSSPPQQQSCGKTDLAKHSDKSTERMRGALPTPRPLVAEAVSVRAECESVSCSASRPALRTVEAMTDHFGRLDELRLGVLLGQLTAEGSNENLSGLCDPPLPGTAGSAASPGTQPHPRWRWPLVLQRTLAKCPPMIVFEQSFSARDSRWTNR